MGKKVICSMRQGDVYLRKLDKLPDGLHCVARGRKQFTAARGEATGHHHTVHCKEGITVYAENEVSEEKLIEDGSKILMELAGEATVTHQEHGTGVLPTGVWEATIQREYDGAEERRVRD